jgi:hypothetical protein
VEEFVFEYASASTNFLWKGVNTMKSYDDLKKEFDDAVEKLRNECPHEDVSDWMEYYWAPAHSTGTLVKSCNFCRQIVRRLRPNFKFEKVEEGQFVQKDLGWLEIDEDGNVVELSEETKEMIEKIQKENEELNIVSTGWTGGEEEE